MSEDDHAFQGIITKLRTTRGSQYALDIMAEAADRIESDAKRITQLEAAITSAIYDLNDNANYGDGGFWGFNALEDDLKAALIGVE